MSEDVLKLSSSFFICLYLCFKAHYYWIELSFVRLLHSIRSYKGVLSLTHKIAFGNFISLHVTIIIIPTIINLLRIIIIMDNILNRIILIFILYIQTLLFFDWLYLLIYSICYNTIHYIWFSEWNVVKYNFLRTWFINYPSARKLESEVCTFLFLIYTFKVLKATSQLSLYILKGEIGLRICL